MTSSLPASSAASTGIDDVAARLAGVRARIAAACAAAARDPGSVALTAVTKTQPPAAIDAILAAGQRVFGENRVQEAQARWQERRPGLPDLELRLIGPLQTNKAADALALFDIIETLDRERLAGALAKAAEASGKTPRVLIQVNTGAEAQKAGVAVDGVETLITRARDLGLAIEGLMCIPPLEADPAPHFDLLDELARRHGLPGLSMGMSADFESAIARGATHVRVGSALFGERIGV